ncbi:UNVERIFIED_ORG: hypothetical protein FNL38_11334 [Nocardia globerula]|uniref:Uncharacterized protein n=1 Tax=Nocardia globerula TaxID=1818 RepID=A0A652YHE2_NOCGL|nr:hypothetical protein C8E04_0633 [Rhodococcus globerulus]
MRCPKNSQWPCAAELLVPMNGAIVILKVGQSLASNVDTTTLIVVRSPQGGDVTLTCGGSAMEEGKKPSGDGSTIDPANTGGALLGKRYVDESSGLEVLCTKSGQGQLALDGVALVLKTAKPLPSSD